MLYLKEGDLYKNVRMLTKEIKSPFYGDIYILMKGEKEDTWTLSAYDEENNIILPHSSNYISDISYDDMLLFINDDTILEYYKQSNYISIKPKKEESDICVGDLVFYGNTNIQATITGIYKDGDNFIYTAALLSDSTHINIVRRGAINEVYKKIN